jgi:hypothetical protein
MRRDRQADDQRFERKGSDVKFEIENGEYVGTAEWEAPGQVAFDMKSDEDRAWFERYFHGEDSFMNGPVEAAEMWSERRDSSPEAFTRAAFQLAAYAYTVRQGDGRRNAARSNGNGST